MNVALAKGHFGAVKALLNLPGTDVNCKDDEGRTLVSLTVDNLDSEKMEQIRFLVEEKSADVTLTDLKGRGPLYYASNLRVD